MAVLNFWSVVSRVGLACVKRRDVLNERPVCFVIYPRPAGKVGGLGVVNTFLKGYKELHDEVDAWLVLKVSMYSTPAFCFQHDNSTQTSGNYIFYM